MGKKWTHGLDEYQTVDTKKVKKKKRKKMRVKNFKVSDDQQQNSSTVMTWSAKAPHDRPISWAHVLLNISMIFPSKVFFLLFFFFPLYGHLPYFSLSFSSWAVCERTGMLPGISPFFLSLLDSLLPWPSDRGESLPILSNHGRFIFYTALWLLSIIPRRKKTSSSSSSSAFSSLLCHICHLLYEKKRIKIKD